jgi:hypothetical protein
VGLCAYADRFPVLAERLQEIKQICATNGNAILGEKKFG